MKTYNKVIFVCNGNTCRSPMAATIMNSLEDNRGIPAISRGMVVLFPEPYNPKAIAVAASHGMIMPSDPALQITGEDFGNDTLVLTMEEGQKSKIYSTFDNAINVYTIQEYTGMNDEQVDDPYGNGMEEYGKCFDILYVLVKKVVEKINKEEEVTDEDSNRM